MKNRPDYPGLRAFMFIPLGDDRVLKSKPYRRWVAKSDAIILDLEDSLPESQKQKGRQNLTEAVRIFSPLNPRILVRVNHDRHLVEDLQSLSGLSVAGVILPKTEAPAQLEEVRAILNGLKQEAEVVPLIETPRGVLELPRILQAHPRMPCLFFGAEDLATGMGLLDPTPLNMAFAAQSVLLQSAAYQIPVVGTLGAFRGFRGEGLKEYAAIVASSFELGFSGVYVVHPYQLRVVAEVSEKFLNLERLHKIVEAGAQRPGVFSVGDEMFGPPMVKRYRAQLRLHEMKNNQER